MMGCLYPLFQWDLVTLESAETLSAEQPEVRLLLTFDTIRPAYKTRTYILAQEDHQVGMMNPHGLSASVTDCKFLEPVS